MKNVQGWESLIQVKLSSISTSGSQSVVSGPLESALIVWPDPRPIKCETLGVRPRNLHCKKPWWFQSLQNFEIHLPWSYQPFTHLLKIYNCFSSSLPNFHTLTFFMLNLISAHYLAESKYFHRGNHWSPKCQIQSHFHNPHPSRFYSFLHYWHHSQTPSPWLSWLSNNLFLLFLTLLFLFMSLLLTLNAKIPNVYTLICGNFINFIQLQQPPLYKLSQVLLPALLKLCWQIGHFHLDIPWSAQTQHASNWLIAYSLQICSLFFTSSTLNAFSI